MKLDADVVQTIRHLIAREVILHGKPVPRVGGDVDCTPAGKAAGDALRDLVKRILSVEDATIAVEKTGAHEGTLARAPQVELSLLVRVAISHPEFDERRPGYRTGVGHCCRLRGVYIQPQRRRHLVDNSIV